MIERRPYPGILRAALGALALACGAERAPEIVSQPGDPLPNLTEAESGRFLLGKALFERLTIPEEGLGPLFNETRCSACHDTPAAGGSGRALVVKATRFENNTCDLLQGQGGDNIQRQATPLLAQHGISGESTPTDATAEVVVTGPSLFGLGLIEAIADTTILANADPEDGDGDGIWGRAVRTMDGRLGRFGRKNEIATAFDFIETALRFELGLTTPMNPAEETVNGVPVPPESDPTPEPEIDERGMRLLADYVRFLAPPSREATSGTSRDSVRSGETLFERIGCATCHVPVMLTAPNDVAALSEQAVPLYSDLLLHDMGPDLADVCGANASPSEYRTARLWGLRYRTLLMHDGRASTPAEAIELHGGEGTDSRTAFAALTSEERAMLLRFLESL
jgi:CxxC motif-containing protein (DUF1111 family)